MSDTTRWAIMIAALPVALFLSYWLARAGEPQSVWLWRDVMGVLR
jgi:hypothetical protein